MELLVELLGVTTQEAVDKIEQFRGAYIRLAWLRYIYHTKCHARQWTLAVRVYSLNLVGCTLFANKSVTYVHVVFLDAFRDLSQTGSYAWGATAPIHMYENLNDASKRSVRQLAGYITLLQVFIIYFKFNF